MERDGGRLGEDEVRGVRAAGLGPEVEFAENGKKCQPWATSARENQEWSAQNDEKQEFKD
jgi:hypothetical protein